ncbi:Uncharacterised protein [[Clostridium] sordellii]|uniref:hypothetical protein n=1 Tax=Paraclostridium sordellii TaxID=1505 RepID=UPI0005E25D56|nr:hypothetical protein [Paeniclostridium sordellii]CEQ01638.1 Uncharacterised protein [[Clostridium] sordellii] [Paeniclostridium sordellii]
MKKFMLSDGMGTFLYAEDLDEDFVVITIEEEDKNNHYTHRSIELHKHDLILLIDRLKELRSK